MKPAVGRVVHVVVVADGSSGGIHAAAIINDVSRLSSDYQVGVTVCVPATIGAEPRDQLMPPPPLPTHWNAWAYHDEKTKAPGTWHWPEREED